MKINATVFFLFFVFSSFSQNMIYKTNGTKISASKIDTSTSSISFVNFNDTSGILNFLSKTVVDSIVFSTGEIFRFNKITPLEKVEAEQKIRKNLLGVTGMKMSSDVVGFIGVKDLNLFYERLIVKDILAGKIQYTYFQRKYLWENKDNSIRAFSGGLNYYFSQTDYHRFGTGFVLQTGNHHYFHPDYDNYNYDNINAIEELDKFTFLMLNLSAAYIIYQRFFITVQANLPFIAENNETNYWEGVYRRDVNILELNLAFNF